MLLSSSVVTSRLLAFVSVAAFLLILWNFAPADLWPGHHPSAIWKGKEDGLVPTQGPTLPCDYDQAPSTSLECAKRYGTLFLEQTSNTSVNYCLDDSLSRLICFHSHLDDDKTHSFCLGQLAYFRLIDRKFELGCNRRTISETELAAGVPQFDAFPTYWYETGTKLILDRHVDISPGGTGPLVRQNIPKGFTILVRREAPIDNLWHHFMQISAIFLTLDVLSMAIDPWIGRTFYGPDDIAHTRVIIFDEHPDGPFYDQWKAFAGRGVFKINEQ